MAIFRCGTCNILREVSNNYIGQAVKCPQCQQVSPIHNTVDFISKVLERYTLLNKELGELRKQVGADESAIQLPMGEPSLSDVDIYNADIMKVSQQHEKIIQWFKKQSIHAEVDHKSIDTSGFFDEIACQIGNNYDTLKPVLDQIRYQQRRNGTYVNLHLSKNSQKEIREITQFCHDLYKYSFVAKYFYQKQEKVVRLTLQQAQAITSFFAGEWLEWYVFIRLLELIQEKQLNASCLRSVKIVFPNEDQHELDVFLLINDSIPVCIECKTGEFRQQIDKYTTLRKRLNLEGSQFVICVIGLEEDQARGLGSMYDMVFTNESNFIEHIEQLLP